MSTRAIFWLHVPSGELWYEKRVVTRPSSNPRLGPWPPQVVLAPVGNPWREIRLYRPEHDPGTGAALLAAPHWLRTDGP